MSAGIGLAPLLLAGAAAAYAASNLLLAQGSAGGLGAALRRPVYLAGTVAQGVGFLLAVAARRDLPLLVVQSGITASLALTAVAGAVLGRWRLGLGQVAAVTAVVAGLALAATSGEPGHGADPGPVPLLACWLALGLALCALPEAALARCGVPPRWYAMVRGTASGLGFGVSAVGARVAVGDLLGDRVDLAGVGHVLGSPTGWLALALVVAGTVVGQILLTAALGAGGVTGPISAMHVVENAGPAAIGLAVLGDHLRPGGLLPAVAGVTLALAGSLALTNHGDPTTATVTPPAQAHHP